MMAVVVTIGVNRHQQQANTQLFTGQMPFLSPIHQHQFHQVIIGETSSTVVH